MLASLKSAAAKLGQALPTIASFILADDVVFKPISKSTAKGIDIASWTVDGKTLVLGGNMGSKSASKTFTIGSSGNVETILSLGAKASSGPGGEITIDFQKFGSIGLIIS